jgi:hypothetical protein
MPHTHTHVSRMLLPLPIRCASVQGESFITFRSWLVAWVCDSVVCVGGTGVLAAAGLEGLDQYRDTLLHDHAMARRLSAG